MHSEIAIDVRAPAALVFGLARDVERWPNLLPHYERARVLSRSADGTALAIFVARRPLIPLVGLGIPLVWRSRTWSDEAGLRLHFRHLGGPTDGMKVTWRIEPRPAGCRVTIEHAFEPRLPLLASLLDRFITRPIAGRTLATFAALAETLATVASPVEPSATHRADLHDPPRPTRHGPKSEGEPSTKTRT